MLARRDQQDDRREHRTDQLTRPVAGEIGGGQSLVEEHGKRDRGIEVAAGDLAERIQAGEQRKPERERRDEMHGSPRPPGCDD